MTRKLCPELLKLLSMCYLWYLCISQADLLVIYNLGRSYMPDLGKLNPSQCSLGNC